MTEVASLGPKLNITTKTTHYVDWFDLSKYLAFHILGAPEHYDFPLLEANNDTDYSVEVKLDEWNCTEACKAERNQVISDFKDDYQRELDKNKDIPPDKSYMRIDCVSIEKYNLTDFMIAAHERGFLEAGNYVVRLSW